MTFSDQQHVIKGPEPAELPLKVSLGRFFYDLFIHQDPNRICMIDAHTKETLTFKSLFENSRILAEILQEFKIGKNSIVSISSENNLQFFVPVFASFFVGSTLAPLNPSYTISELKHALNISKPTLILCSEKVVDKFRRLQRECRFIKKIIIIDGKVNIPGVLKLTKLIEDKKRKGTLRNFKPLDGNPDQMRSFIMCSSGTTGLPKGVLQSHTNTLHIMSLFRDPRYARIDEKDTVLGIMPFFHAFGLHVGLFNILKGCTLVLLKHFQDDFFLKTIQDYHVTTVFLAPPLAVFLAKSPKIKNYDLSSIKKLSSGGAPLKKSIENELIKLFKLDGMKQSYGMTETTLTTTAFKKDEFKEGSVGKLIPLLRAVIRNPDTGESLGAHKVGEICLKGPNIMLGYYNNEKATKEAFTSDGYLKTGDLGYYDDEGFFFIVDRLKELIKYKGYQVAPAELEEILLNHSKIRDVGVVGKPDDECGELPVAFVSSYPGVKISKDEIHDYINDKVSSQKRLRGGVIFLEEIPKNQSGKILRKELRKMLEKQLSKL